MRRTSGPTSRVRPLAPAALLTLALLPLGVASASAEGHRSVDPAHDVVRISTGQRVFPAPQRQDVDIRKTRVRHGLGRVDIRVTLRNLKVGDVVMDVSYVTNKTKGSTGPLPSSEVRWNPAHPHRPLVTLTSGRVTCAAGPGSQGGDGIRTHTYYGADVVDLSFPRSCLARRGSQPTWIRASITVHTGDRPTYWDQASYPRPYPAHRPVGWFSPRLYAGPRAVSGGKTRHDT